MDATRKFDGRAKDYTVGRPGYAPGLIDCLYTRYGLSGSSAIADIGSGTGKFAKHLLDRGSQVYGVEPNDDMRAVAESELCGYPNFHSVSGTAENTALESDSVDFITAAQAFHWFDAAQFKRECARILKKDGSVILIWNAKDGADPLNRALYRIDQEFCPDFKGFAGGVEKDDLRIKQFFDDRYDYIAFDNPLYFDKEKFIYRCLSGSYSLKQGDRRYDEYIDALASLFDRFAADGTVTMGNKSVAYIGRRPQP